MQPPTSHTKQNTALNFQATNHSAGDKQLQVAPIGSADLFAMEYRLQNYVRNAVQTAQQQFTVTKDRDVAPAQQTVTAMMQQLQQQHGLV